MTGPRPHLPDDNETTLNGRSWLVWFIGIAAAASIFGAAYLLFRRRKTASFDASSLITQISGLTEAEASARRTPVDREAEKKGEARQFWRALLRKNLLTFYNLDMIGVAIAMYLLGSAWSAFLSLLLLVSTFGLNVFQEIYTKRKLDGLMEGLQPQATVIRENRVRSISLERIVPGDMLVASIGDRIILDGEIVGDGRLSLDEITGTAGVVHRQKRAGESVYAGSICTAGQAVYRVTEPEPQETLRSQRLQASILPRTSTPLQRLIERVFQILFVLVVIFNGLLFLEMSATWLGIAIFDGALIRDVVSQIFALAPTSLFFMIAVSYAVGLAHIVDIGALVYRGRNYRGAGQYVGDMF